MVGVSEKLPKIHFVIAFKMGGSLGFHSGESDCHGSDHEVDLTQG